jgi:hypothetical protein
MLSLVDRTTPEAQGLRLRELTAALRQEHRLLEELRAALLRQRAGVAEDDTEMVEGSVHAVGRSLFALEEARRRRLDLTRQLAAGDDALADLERRIGRLPADLAAAREDVRRSAEATSHEVAINQRVLRRALDAGDAYLQQLFSSVASPTPAYVPGARAPEGAPSGLLLNRTA